MKYYPELGLVGTLNTLEIFKKIYMSLNLAIGFSPQDIILNGNGKQEWEIKLAIQLSTMLNVDSIFDAQNILRVWQQFDSTKEGTTAAITHFLFN